MKEITMVNNIKVHKYHPKKMGGDYKNGFKKSHNWEIVSHHTMEEIVKECNDGNIKSKRVLNLLKLGPVCVDCKIEGTKWIRTRDAGGGIHLDLYSEDDTLITIDHIIPKSKGGKDHIDNMQTMCKVCNESKGNQIRN